MGKGSEAGGRRRLLLPLLPILAALVGIFATASVLPSPSLAANVAANPAGATRLSGADAGAAEEAMAPDSKPASSISAEPPPQVEATRRIGRSEIVRLTATRHGRVAAAHSEVDRAEARAGRVRAARMPEIQVMTFISSALKAESAEEHSAKSTRSLYSFRAEDLSAAFGARLEITLPVYTFGKLDLRRDAAAHSHAAAEAGVTMTAAEVALEAVQIYEAHLLSREARRFLEDMEAFGLRSVEDAEQRLEDRTPDASMEDVLRLRSGLALARLGLHQAEAAEAQTREGLRAYLSLGREEEIEAADSTMTPLTMEAGPLEALVELALHRRPEFEALHQGIAAYGKLAEATTKDLYPDIFLYGLLSGAYTPGREFSTSRYIFDPIAHFLPVALVGARWTFQWDAPNQAANEVRVEATKLQGLLAWAKQGIPAEVNRALEDVRRARADLATLAASLPLTKQWMVRASADYGVGFGDSRALAESVTAYIQMKLAELDAVYRLNLGLAALGKATGTLLDAEAPIYPGPGG